MSEFDPEILKESRVLVERVRQEGRTEGIQLEEEAFCKKVWMPWFRVGNGVSSMI